MGSITSPSRHKHHWGPGLALIQNVTAVQSATWMWMSLLPRPRDQTQTDSMSCRHTDSQGWNSSLPLRLTAIPIIPKDCFYFCDKKKREPGRTLTHQAHALFHLSKPIYIQVKHRSATTWTSAVWYPPCLLCSDRPEAVLATSSDGKPEWRYQTNLLKDKRSLWFVPLLRPISTSPWLFSRPSRT